jgi:hypothetical protein
VAIIQLVAKTGTPSGPSDFRLIIIVSFLSKAFERTLHDQVLEHVNGCNLLSDSQFGFTREHSTATVLVSDTKYLRLTKAEEKVNFSKAFDLINHGLFFNKLGSRFDYHTLAMGMVSSYFFGILLWRLRLMMSNPCHVLCRLVSHRDVSQLRCFLYVYQMIYIRSSMFHFYADDRRFICLRIGRIWME